jgi:EmrB/QacA subfamily drug resistance transporter
MSSTITKTNTTPVVIGLLIGILVAAMDNTIVATAMPTIVSELNGFDQYAWVTSAYKIATVAGMPIFGKLSDMYGRKRFFLFGMLIFMIGSILCGMADSIIELSAYRALQGLGGGALMPIAFTIIFDIFPPEKRGKVSGLFGAVFGISSIFGPLLGALLTDSLDWRWVFYINIPLGLIALGLVTVFYQESPVHRTQKIDYVGAFTLVAGLILFLLALEMGGKEYAWSSPQILGLFGAALVAFVAFAFAERRAADPVITFSLFRRRLFAATQGVAFFYGFVFISASVFIPIFVQGVFGGSATNSGLILMPMLIASVISAQLGGQLPNKFGFRNVMIVSAVFFLLGVYLLSTMTLETSRTAVTIYMIILGFGVGFSFSLLNLVSINGIEMQRRGAATSMGSTFRTIGMTLGVTVLGIIQSRTFTSAVADRLPQGGAPSGGQFPTAAAFAKMPPEVATAIKTSLAESISTVYFWALIPAVLGVIFIFLMGNERPILSEQATPAKKKQAQ